MKTTEAAARISDGLTANGMPRIDGGYLGIFNMRAVREGESQGYAGTLQSYALTQGQAQGAKPDSC